MRYSIIFATFAASAIATPYINVEVSEPGDLVPDRSHKNHRHNDHGMKRPHHGGRNDRDDRDGRDDRVGGWFSSLWRKHRDDDDDRRGGHGRRGDHRGRDDDRDRDGDDDNDRRGRRGRRGDRRDRDGDDDDEFHPNNLMDGLFGSDYECVIEANSEQKEKKDARECCQRVGGELYDIHGRCVFRDVYDNPREDWRTCAMEQSGAFFADCYYREPREVDDELSNRRRHSKSRSRSRDGKDRKNRNGHRRHRHDRDGGNNDRDNNGRDNNDRQIFLGRDDEDNNGRGRRNPHELVCKLNLNDENRERQITRECCQQRNVDGKLTQNDQRCEIRDGHVYDFEECAEEEGVNEDQIQCSRVHGREEF